VSFSVGFVVPIPTNPAVVVVMTVPPVPTLSVDAVATPTVISGVPVRPPAVPVVFWLSVGNVQLVRVPEAGVPNAGVANVGLVANTASPVPVLEVSAILRAVDVKEPNEALVPLEIISPVKFGILVVDVAVPVSAPTNVVAVTTPVKVPSPVTVRALVGFVVPMPTLESV
jgi:hypothetical protein